MSVVVETTLGDITIDLFLKERPRACLNFLKLCKIKYYNYNLFHTVSRDFIAQTGDPTGSRNGGESVWGVLEGPLKRFFEPEKNPRIKHTAMGLVSFVGNDDNMIGSQFFITLGTDLTYLDEQHCVFAEVVEGLDVLEILNEAICDTDNRPYQDIRITHTVILDDPFPDPKNLRIPERSPSPSAERLQGGRIAPDEDIDETMGKSVEEIQEIIADREAKARATILEMVGDIPDAEMAPPENVLFVCKLNPVTTDDDLEIIFSRFGKIKSCEIIRDKKTGDSLQYAFVEFEEQKSCEDAYFKMDNVLIDDRRIHVDFSQSVAKVKWHGKGRGVTTYDEKGRKTNDSKNDIGQGRYKSNKPSKDRNKEEKKYRNGQNKEDNRFEKNREEKRSFRETSDEKSSDKYRNRDRREDKRDSKSNRRSWDREINQKKYENYKYEDSRSSYFKQNQSRYENRRGNRYEDRYENKRVEKYDNRGRDRYENTSRDRYESRGGADRYEYKSKHERPVDNKRYDESNRKYEKKEISFERREETRKKEFKRQNNREDRDDKVVYKQTKKISKKSQAKRKHDSESSEESEVEEKKSKKTSRKKETKKSRKESSDSDESSESTSSSSSSSSSDDSEYEARKRKSKRKKRRDSSD